MCVTKLANATVVPQSPGYDGETSDTPESIHGQDPADTAKSPRRDPLNIPQVVPDGLPLIRENLIQKELSDAAQNIIMNLWCKGTTKQYRSYLSRWTDFCKRQDIFPYSPGTTKAIEFLTKLFHLGVSYSAIKLPAQPCRLYQQERFLLE